MLTACLILMSLSLSHGAVEFGLFLAGKSLIARGVVLGLATLTGTIIGWTIMDNLIGWAAGRDEV